MGYSGAKMTSKYLGAIMTSAINFGYLVFQLMVSGYFTQWLAGHWMPSIILAGSVIGVLGYGACLFGLSSTKKIVVIVGLAIVGVGIVLCLIGLFYGAFGYGFRTFEFFQLIIYSGLQASAVTLTAIVCASMGSGHPWIRTYCLKKVTENA